MLRAAGDITSSRTGWRARLKLRFARDVGSGPAEPVTRLVERHHQGPLVVQRPFHPEGGPCHVYLVHPPGGVVGGDELRLDAQVEAGAHALITTPAATKFYRCEGRGSSQTQELRAAGATLEWLPQENIFYRGAEVRACTRVYVDSATRFIGWEINCLGLPARGEVFETGALGLDLELWSPNAPCISGAKAFESFPVFMDRLRLRGESRAREARWGLAGQEAVGTLLATPGTPHHVQTLRELVRDQPLVAVSLVDGVLVLRALAPQAQAVRNLFMSAWRALRPAIIGREAVPPRIWAT